MFLKPVSVWPLAWLGNVAVPPGTVLVYAAPVATLFGTTSCTPMSMFCARGTPPATAKHWTCAHVIGSPLVVAALADNDHATSVAAMTASTDTIETILRRPPDADRKRR